MSEKKTGWRLFFRRLFVVVAVVSLVVGAYSYNRLGGSGQDRETLAEPVAGRVFFAGEATHRRMYGSVAGAYHSGLRAAKEVVKSASLAFT